MDTLTSRQQSILNRVVDTHIETAQPVGSQSITQMYRKQYNASFSPATVRFEMGVLEEIGYLTHPHTSSGRVPTDLGYRYYVDHCLQQEEVPHSIFGDLKARGHGGFEGIEFLVENAGKILSKMTDEVCLILIEDISSGFEAPRRKKLFLQGTATLLHKPEFQDVDKVRALIEVLEEKTRITDWLGSQTPERGVNVRIGRENNLEALRDCALISVSYAIAGENGGAVAVLGPRRMHYSRALPLVSQMAKRMERICGHG